MVHGNPNVVLVTLRTVPPTDWGGLNRHVRRHTHHFALVWRPARGDNHPSCPPSPWAPWLLRVVPRLNGPGCDAQLANTGLDDGRCRELRGGAVRPNRRRPLARCGGPSLTLVSLKLVKESLDN